MSFTIIRPRDHAEWMKHREGGIGSSEVGTILGLNPFETPYQLWRRKRGIDPPKEENFAMRAGHYLEDAVSRFYADATGKEIIKRSAGDWLVVDGERPYLRVSPDRTFWIPDRPHSDRNKGILECKTTQMQVDADDVPQHWFCQLQYQLGVAELEQGALAWLTMGREFGYRDITFDAEFYAWMVDEVERFWVDNIQGGLEPLPLTADDVLLRNPRHVPGKTVKADGAMAAAIAELRTLKEDGKVADTRRAELESALKLTLGDAEALVAADDPRQVLVTWRAAKDGRKFDEKQFAADHPELYEQYRRTVPGSRRFLLK